MPSLVSLQAMPRRTQLALAGGLLVLLCAVLIAAYLVFLRPRYEVLFTKLRAADAAAIVAELDKRKVAYRLEDGGATILVPERESASARLDVLSNELPIKGMVGFELFNKSDMGLTEFAQKINYQRALQGELSRTIMELEGIESARVHLSMSEPTIFRSERVPPKASVTITPAPDRPLSPRTVRCILRLVAASVPELEISNVVVVDEEGQVVSIDPADGAAASSPFLQKKAAIETLEAARLREKLAPDYRDEDLSLGVWADIGHSRDSSADLASSGLGAAARQYRLVVTVTPHRNFTDAERGDIIELCAEAIAFNPGMGDVISFAPVMPQASDLNPTQAAKTPARPIFLPARSSSPFQRYGAFVIAGLGILLAGAAALRWTGMRRERRRALFVERFQAMLREEEE